MMTFKKQTMMKLSFLIASTLFLANIEKTAAIHCNLCASPNNQFDHVPKQNKGRTVQLKAYGKQSCMGLYDAALYGNIFNSYNQCYKLRSEFGPTCCNDSEGGDVPSVDSILSTKALRNSSEEIHKINAKEAQENRENALASCLQVKDYEEILGNLYEVNCDCSDTGILFCSQFSVEQEKRETCSPKDFECNADSDCCGVHSCKQGTCRPSSGGLPGKENDKIMSTTRVRPHTDAGQEEDTAAENNDGGTRKLRGVVTRGTE